MSKRKREDVAQEPIPTKEPIAAAEPVVDTETGLAPEGAAPLPSAERVPTALTPGSNEPMEMGPDVQVNVTGTPALATEKAVEVTDEDDMNQFFDYDMNDIVGDDPDMQETLKQIRSQATSDMKPSRKLALAFTALADPQYAERQTQQHGQKKDRAQQTLLGLGTSLFKARKEGQRQSMIADRQITAQAASFEKQTAAFAAKTEEAERKQRWAHNSGMIQQRIKEMGAMRIPTNLLPPTDMTDEAAVQGYLITSQDEMTQGKKVLDTIQFFEDTVDLDTVGDPEAAKDAFRTVGLAHGNTPEQVEAMVEGYGPMITNRVKLAKQTWDKQQAKIDAEIGRMDSNVEEARMKVRQMEQSIKTGNMKDLRSQSLVVKDMASAYAQMNDDYQQLVSLGPDLAWTYKNTQDLDETTYRALAEENTKLRQAAMPRLGEFGRLVQHAQQRMQQFDQKLRGSENFERIFNTTMTETLMANPDLAADPAAAAEMVMSGPMEGPRADFWYQVHGRLQAEYPKMSMNEIYSLIDEDAADQLQQMMQQPGMPAETHEGAMAPHGAALPDHGGMPTPQGIESGSFWGGVKKMGNAAIGRNTDE